MLVYAADKDLPVVLLIDDDLVSREVMATVLTMSGYTVHTAVDGDTSIKVLASGACRPGVILMDAQMPGLSGTELIAQLRLNSTARIYVVSGSHPPEEVTDAADGLLLKPFTPEELHRLLDTHQSRNAASLLDPKDPIVSGEVLAQFRKMMPESALRQIYLAVVADLSRRIDALDRAIKRGDIAEIRRIGHAIKGGCGMAGAVQAAHLGAMLEAAPNTRQDNQLDNSATLLQDLRIAAQGLERMLDAELPA
jgi:CheY-like chemotaxis protein